MLLQIAQIFVGLIATVLADLEDSSDLTREKKDVSKLQSIAASLTGGYLPSKYSPGYNPGWYTNDNNYNRWCDCRSQYNPSSYPTGGGVNYFAYKYRPQPSYPIRPIVPPASIASDDTVVVYPRPATTYGIPVPQQTSFRLPAQPSLPPPPPPSAPSVFNVGASYDTGSLGSPPPPPPVVTYQKPIGPSITTNIGPSGYSYDRPAVPFKI